LGKFFVFTVVGTVAGTIMWIQIWLTRFRKLWLAIKKKKIKIVAMTINEMAVDLGIFFLCMFLFGTTNFALLTSLGINISTSFILAKMIQKANDKAKMEVATS
jgi:hypothetical protein